MVGGMLSAVVFTLLVCRQLTFCGNRPG